MKYFIYIFLLLSTIGFCNQLSAQTYTTESKNCGACGKGVSKDSRVGMRCPHCSVRWGYENETRSTNYIDYMNSPNSSYRMNFEKNSLVTVQTNVNLRSQPSKKASIRKVIPAYSTSTIISKTGDWYYVEYMDYDFSSSKIENIKGYLHTSVVK